MKTYIYFILISLLASYPYSVSLAVEKADSDIRHSGVIQEINRAKKIIKIDNYLYKLKAGCKFNDFIESNKFPGLHDLKPHMLIYYTTWQNSKTREVQIKEIWIPTT